MKNITALTLAALMASAAVPALAQEKGDFLLGLGLGYVEPTQNSNTLAGQIDVDGATAGAPSSGFSIVNNAMIGEWSSDLS